jgi:putative membrane protein
MGVGDEVTRFDPSDETEVDERRERAFVDADRIMMQVIQTSLSLIGFGFTINTLFQSAVVRGLAPATDAGARRLGLALLVLGLLLLAMGIWNQVRLLETLANRYGRGQRWLRSAYHYNATPSLLIAILLLIVGFLALLIGLRYSA